MIFYRERGWFPIPKKTRGWGGYSPPPICKQNDPHNLARLHARIYGFPLMASLLRLFGCISVVFPRRTYPLLGGHGAPTPIIPHPPQQPLNSGSFAVMCSVHWKRKCFVYHGHLCLHDHGPESVLLRAPTPGAVAGSRTLHPRHGARAQAAGHLPCWWARQLAMRSQAPSPSLLVARRLTACLPFYSLLWCLTAGTLHAHVSPNTRL